MTNVKEIIEVPLGARVTEDSILRYFESRRGSDGTIKIGLRIALRDFGVPANLAVEHDVAVDVAKRRDAENINDEIAVSWTPIDDGAFPKFAGRLIVWSEERADESFIELEGTYEPPLGTAGEFFDAAIGYLIAQRTAQAFLTDLKDAAVAMQRLAAKQQKIEP